MVNSLITPLVGVLVFLGRRVCSHMTTPTTGPRLCWRATRIDFRRSGSKA